MSAQVSREQRIGIFVDVQNLYHSARELYGAKVNFANLLKDAIRNRKLVRALAYVIRAAIEEEKIFFEALKKFGYEVKAKDLQIFPGGAKKGDWDIGIAMDAIELAPKLDTIVLCSGDGDFVPLVEHLRRALGCRIEVIAFGRSTSTKLKECADEFIDLDQNPSRYTRKLSKASASRFGREQRVPKIAGKPKEKREEKERERVWEEFYHPELF